IGFVVALAGALTGAWIGFNVTSAGFGLLAPLLAIVGAAVGANLLVLALDIAWDWQALIPEEEPGSSARPSSNPTSRRRPPDDPVVASQVLSNQGETIMNRTKPYSNLAARMGRWSAAHWETATFGWLALLVVAFAVSGQIGTKNINPTTSGPGESGRMDRSLHDGCRLPANESVLIQSKSARAGTPAFDAAVRDVVARVSKASDVQNVRSPKIAKSGHAALVEFQIKGDKDKAADKLGPVL